MGNIIEKYNRMLDRVGRVTRFAIHSFVVMMIIGIYLIFSISASHEKHTVENLAESTMLSGKAAIAPSLEKHDFSKPVQGKKLKELDETIKNYFISEDIVRVKIWNKKGMIIYSDEHELIGKTFKIENDLKEAFEGKLEAEIKELDKDENIYEKRQYDKLIEIYVPLYKKGLKNPVGAYEAYLATNKLDNTLAKDRNIIIMYTTFGLIFLYITLIWFFREAFNRIRKQTIKLRDLNIRLEDSLLTLKESYYDTVKVLTLAVDAKDHYTAGHSIRVADISVAIAREMRMKRKRVETIERAALFHDIGKIGIPGNILNKTGKLKDSEWTEMKRHPVVGYKIMSAVKVLTDTVDIIKHHHEHYDGSGYPDGLKSKEISLESRIIAVADAYDAMTTNRPHQAARSTQAALEEIASNSGTQFDQKIVKALIRVVKQGEIHHSSFDDKNGNISSLT